MRCDQKAHAGVCANVHMPTYVKGEGGHCPLQTSRPTDSDTESHNRQGDTAEKDQHRQPESQTDNRRDRQVGKALVGPTRAQCLSTNPLTDY